MKSGWPILRFVYIRDCACFAFSAAFCFSCSARVPIIADDYVVKPFSPRELVLRVRAVLRRMEVPAEAPHEIRRGALWLDLEGHRCTVGELPVELTAKA